MAIDVELKTLKQSNTTWPSTFKASNRFPIVANRVFATLEKAQQYVDDTAADASAYKGIVLAVVEDSIAKNNGVYYVESVAMTEGETGKLVKVGGTETETAKNYSAAKTLSNTLVLGQLIKVSEEETITEGEGEDAKEVTYQAGFYIVEGAGVISALATSTGSDDEVGALKGRVSALETTVGNEEAGLVKEVADLKETVEAIEIPEVPVQDVTVNGESVLGEDGIAAIEIPEVPVKGVTVDGADVVGEDGIAAIEIPVKGVKVDGVDVVGEDGVAVITMPDLEPYAKTADVEAELAKKVDVKEGERLMTDAEGEKLAAIAEGAQVNVIETVKVNGTALEVSDKGVNIVIEAPKVKGVDGADKMLSLTEAGEVKSELSIVYVKAEDSDDNKPHIALFGKGGTTLIDSIDATDFVKDGMIDTVTLVDTAEGKKALQIVWNTAAGKETVNLDVTDLLDYYYAGDGIALDDATRKFSIDLKEGETFLVVDAAGLGIDETALWGAADAKYDAKGAAASAQAAAEATAQKYTDDTIAALELEKTYEKAGVAQGLIDALNLPNTYDAKGAAASAQTAAQEFAQGLNDDMDERVKVLEAVDHESFALAADVEAELAKKVDVEEGKRLMTTAEGEKLAAISEGAQVNVIESINVNGVEAAIDNKKAEVSIAANKMQLGDAITTDGQAVAEDNSNVAYAADAYVPTVLQGIYQSIRAAVAGGVNSVTANDTSIEVNTNDANNPKVGVKVEASSETTVAAGHIELVKGAEGLYGVMYYDGDDSEE